jgi:hypothetical protein
MDAQGCKIIEDVVFRDNTSAMKLENNMKTSAMKLENNMKTSAGKRASHVEIKYFYATDLIKRKQAIIKDCSTDSMIAGYMI